MSEQDKEMEAAAEQYYKTSGWVPTEWAVMNFKAGWKAASERKDADCEAGCQVFDGGEKRHHKDCVFYPESFTKMYDDLQSKLATVLAALEWYANDGHTGRPILAGNVAREAIALIKGDAK